MQRTIALILGMLIAGIAASSAHPAKIDWSQIKPVDAAEMKWLVVEQTADSRAMFGIPDSDGALLWFDCIAKGSIALSYVDHQLQPFAQYHVHLKTGSRAIEVAGKTGERLQLDDLVILQTAPITDKQFLTNLKKGDDLALVIDQEKKGRLNALALPGHGSALDPFFKACGV